MKIKADVITSRLEIHFSDGQVYNVKGVSDSDNKGIVSLVINEELAYKNATPLGVVSSNTCVFKLCNDGTLTPSNNKSPYYGMMQDGAIVKPYIKIDGVESLFGIYYVKSWSSGVEFSGYKPVEITCGDWISTVLNRSIPFLPIRDKMSVSEFAVLLFKSLGLTENQYNISSDLNKMFGFGCVIGAKVGDVLNTLASGSISNVFCDRNGIVNVVSASIKSVYSVVGHKINEICEVSGSNVIISGGVVDGGMSKYKGVRVMYDNKSKSDSVLIHSMLDVVINPGVNRLDNIKVKDGSIYSIDSVNILNTKLNDRLVYLDAIDYGQDYINLEIKNDSLDALSVQVDIYGTTIVSNKSYIDRVTGIAKEINDDSMFKVDNSLIQSIEYATSYANDLIEFMGFDVPIVELSTVINPLIKIGDVVKVKLDKAGLYIYGQVTSLKFNFGGAYRCVMQVKNLGGVTNG